MEEQKRLKLEDVAMSDKKILIKKITQKKFFCIKTFKAFNNLAIDFLGDFSEELKKHKTLYDMSLTVGPEDRSYTGKRNDLIQTDTGLQKMYRGKGYWKPFLNMTKKDFADLYEKHNLMDSLFPYTASCVAKAGETNNFTKPCQKCFWCLEKYWAFNMYDYPQAYDL